MSKAELSPPPRSRNSSLPRNSALDMSWEGNGLRGKPLQADCRQPLDLIAAACFREQVREDQSEILLPCHLQYVLIVQCGGESDKDGHQPFQVGLCMPAGSHFTALDFLKIAEDGRDFSIVEQSKIESKVLVGGSFASRLTEKTCFFVMRPLSTSFSMRPSG